MTDKLEVGPFGAIRYNRRTMGADLSAVLAPPYDVLDEHDKAALLAKNPRNIVAVDLPHLPPKTAGPSEAYQQSARWLAEWLSDGTLARDATPALYVYHQRFEHDSRTYTRQMFIARARLTPFWQGCILPHEQTFGGPKEDRMALMKATQCNLSPVFGLYSDPQGRVDAAFSPYVAQEPDARGTLEGVENRLWLVEDHTAIETVVSTMADKRVYIADGHHRYETALRYRDDLAQKDCSLPRNHAAHFVMVVLARIEDPGCLILPYHRVLTRIELPALLKAWAEGTVPCDTGSGSGDLLLVDGASGRRAGLSFTRRNQLAALEPKQPAPWHALDTAYLHRYLIDELLPRGAARVAPSTPKVEYVKSVDDALRVAREQSGVALLMNATPMASLKAVSESGGLMPQKSTYFHPKLATGLTIHPLT